MRNVAGEPRCDLLPDPVVAAGEPCQSETDVPPFSATGQDGGADQETIQRSGLAPAHQAAARRRPRTFGNAEG